MNTIFYRKSIVSSAMVAISVISLVLTGCQNELFDLSLNADFIAFEEEFATSLSSENETVKLIGFKTYDINESDRQHFINLVEELGDTIKKFNAVFSEDFSFYRIYFPLHTAIVDYNDKTYTADEKGVVIIPNLTDISKVKIIGRKRSETVHGTGSNIIEKDRILLKTEFRQEVKNGVMAGYSIDGNACVFDFKALTSMDMDATCCSKTAEVDVKQPKSVITRIMSSRIRLKSGNEGEEGSGVSCNQNHGGMNCSNAFGIYNGGCPFVSSHCMDYNGWLFGPSDCIKGPKTYFLGSDCCEAMALGHCWNEVN